MKITMIDTYYIMEITLLIKSQTLKKKIYLSFQRSTDPFNHTTLLCRHLGHHFCVVISDIPMQYFDSGKDMLAVCYTDLARQIKAWRSEAFTI
jgi:hypothetical protein